MADGAERTIGTTHGLDGKVVVSAATSPLFGDHVAVLTFSGDAKRQPIMVVLTVAQSRELRAQLETAELELTRREVTVQPYREPPREGLAVKLLRLVK